MWNCYFLSLVYNLNININNKNKQMLLLTHETWRLHPLIKKCKERSKEEPRQLSVAITVNEYNNVH